MNKPKQQKSESKEHMKPLDSSQLKTKEEIKALEAQVAKNNKVIIATIVIICLALVGVIMLKASLNKPVEAQSTSYTYHNFAFIQDASGMWQTMVNSKDSRSFVITSYYSPRDLQDIPMNKTIYKEIIGKSRVYMTLDIDALETQVGGIPKATIAAIEVNRITGPRFGILNIDSPSAILKENDEVQGSPVVTCANATQTTSVIIFTLGNTTSVSNSGNCITVQGTNPNEIIRAADLLMYNIAGIMR